MTLLALFKRTVGINVQEISRQFFLSNIISEKSVFGV